MSVLEKTVSSTSEAPLRVQTYGWHADYPGAAEAARNAWASNEQNRFDDLKRELRATSDFNTTTYAGVGFHRIANDEEPMVQNQALQKRLDMLCEKLRARY